MDQTTLQIRLDKDLKAQAEAVSADMGFSSLQENIRVYIKQLAKKTFRLSLENQSLSEQLSRTAAKRYDQMIKDMESGKEKTYVANDINDLMDQLNGNKDPVLKDIS